MKKLSFRSQFAITLAITFLLSIVCTLAVWGASIYFLKTYSDKFQPANHYEQQIPDIALFVRENEEKLLQREFQEELEEVVPLEGMDYQVVALSGEPVYGSTEESWVSSPNEIVDSLNTTQYKNGKFHSYHPVMNEQGHLSGAIIFRYSLDLVSSNSSNSAFILLFIIGNMAAPFLFILLFTLLLARKVGKRLEPPISRLIQGAERIQRQDLDFTFTGEGGSKEITQLASAFEEMRSALHASLQAQWQMEQERRDMVAALAHDLRTPLTIVQGHVDNLLENESKRAERLEDYLQTIRKSTERAVRLLNEMNAVSEIERLDFALTFQNTDLVAFSQSKIEEYKLLCEAKQIEFVPELILRRNNGWMTVDSHRLEQMLDNVLGNSMRFTPPGGTILWRITLEENQAVMEVEDSGPGFAAKDMSYLFQKFYQGDPSRTRNKGHAGLGLYIVKTLAEKHGGTASLSNRAEGGAYVSFRIKSYPF
ncbi:sensor histidine kinase [Paenibacillus senegalensis]|uniref:sensor histidine kinase n=1 Tax=Paenibacillus senegalensis TaxID=1465766 RepID=UPI000289684D|nr:HAMP domain-containing sensor histidine kinase [Paenibacillus senegalensis]